MSRTISLPQVQKAVKPKLVKPKPVNNLYWVPVSKLSFLGCSDGSSLVGDNYSHYLVEANSEADAAAVLSKSSGFAENYFKLPVEQRKDVRRPFRFREGQIIKVLECRLRFKNNIGDYTCGVPIHDLPEHEDHDFDMVNGNGEHGMCCVEGHYEPSFGMGCPYEHGESIKPAI